MPHESHTPPSAPNYIIQSNEVNLWIEDGDELALSRTPPLSTISRRPVMPLGQDHDRDTTNNERQPRRLTNNKLARWALYAVLFYLVVATFVTLLAPRPRPRPRQPWLEQVYQPTPVQPEAITDVLPVYERYENLCHRQTFYPRNSTFFALPLDTMEAHSMSRLNNACLPAKYIGAMWSREKGLTMDMDEHFYYKKSLEEGGPVYDGIDLWKLCSATDMAMMRASSGFKDVLSSLVSRVSQAGRVGLESLARELIYREYHDRDNATWSSHFEKPYTTGPAAPPTPTPDPSPLLSLGLFKHNTLNPERGMNLRTMARSGLESMNNLRQLLKNATQHLDQVLDITGQIIQDVTVQTPEEPPFWKRWFESFEDSFGRQEAVRKAKLLDETKDKMGFLLETRQNLTVVEAALEELVDEQEDILYEEDDISFWIQLLLDHASLSSQADTDDIVRLQDDKGDILIAGKWHANLWAQYRPKSEKEEYGQWCLYPDCPPAQGETVLVRLYVPNPTEAVKALFPIWLSLAKEDNELFMALHRRMKEKFGD
ncbi:hypothetical protein ACHAPT_013050 [Fusarium lateritium]